MHKRLALPWPSEGCSVLSVRQGAFTYTPKVDMTPAVWVERRWASLGSVSYSVCVVDGGGGVVSCGGVGDGCVSVCVLACVCVCVCVCVCACVCVCVVVVVVEVLLLLCVCVCVCVCVKGVIV